MTLNVEQFYRKSFPVDCVRVTEENFEEVSRWCSGEIHEDTSADNPSNYPRYIKVRVHNPLTERQTKAYVGDWVLYAGKGYKVYTDKAFRKSFNPKTSENVFDQSIETGTTFNSSAISGNNPGGTSSVG